MTSARPVLSNAAARRVFLDRHGLLVTTGGPGRGRDLSQVIAALGFVQIDSVNTFARAHDLILWARRQQYRPGALDGLLARDRAVFEHWTHDAAAIPMAFYPHWRLKFDRDAARLRQHWQVWRRDGFLERLDDVLDHVTRLGPCTSRDVGGGEVKASGGWWDWHPSKTALEYLWRSGTLAVCRRDGFRKVYDLAERVIPAEVSARRPDRDETLDWACAAALDRLGFATAAEIAAFWDIATLPEARAWCDAARGRGEIEEIEVALADGTCRACFARPGLPGAASDLPPASSRVRLLSPFDPALRDRARAERLFGFSYRIEIFVPEARRSYGYYVFPVMEGTSLIGRIDMRADRKTRTLAVRAFWPERGGQMGKGRRTRLMSELDRAAALGGCDRVDYASGWLRDPA